MACSEWRHFYRDYEGRRSRGPASQRPTLRLLPGGRVQDRLTRARVHHCRHLRGWCGCKTNSHVLVISAGLWPCPARYPSERRILTSRIPRARNFPRRHFPRGNAVQCCFPSSESLFDTPSPPNPFEPLREIQKRIGNLIRSRFNSVRIGIPTLDRYLLTALVPTLLLTAVICSFVGMSLWAMMDLIRAVGSAGTRYPYSLITNDLSRIRIVPDRSR